MFIDGPLDRIVRDVTPSDGEFARATARADYYGSVLTRDAELGARAYAIGGSCAKRTALRPIDDVDLFVFLERGAFARFDGKRRQPAAVLQAFQERLDVTTRGMVGVTTRLQTHSVRIVHSGQRSMDVDIVPAFPRRGDVVEIPERGTRKWITTSVARQLQLLNELDAPNRALRRTIRMAKYWRDQHDVALCSYALEVLVLLAAHRGVPRHPSKLLIAGLRLLGDDGLRAPFSIERFWKADGHLAGGIYDPASKGNNLTAYLDAEERRAIASRARRSAEALERACDYADKGQPGRAEERIRAAFADAA